MSTIKKMFVEVHEILSSNQDKKVSEVLDQLMPLFESKQRDKNHRTNENGELEIFCYYHKQWENTEEVEYGKKANTATGLNSMCKIGTNQWTKQQREFKKAKADLLELVADGSVSAEEIPARIEELEAEKDKIKPLSESLAEMQDTEE
jgi:hypothetical protein